MNAELDVDETDLQILNLLYLGLADAVVGRRLGIGHRTVQRRVRDLMARLKAKSRVALGARAQELGLLNRSPRAANSPVKRYQYASPTVHAQQMCPDATVWHAQICCRRVVEVVLAGPALREAEPPAVIKAVVQAGCASQADQIKPERWMTPPAGSSNAPGMGGVFTP